MSDPSNPSEPSPPTEPDVERVLRDLAGRGLLGGQRVVERARERIRQPEPPAPALAQLFDRAGPTFVSSCGLRNLTVLSQLYGSAAGDAATAVLRAVVAAVLVEDDPESVLVQVRGPDVVVLHGPLPRSQVESAARRIRDVVAAVSLPIGAGIVRLRPSVVTLELRGLAALSTDQLLRTLHLVRVRAQRSGEGFALLDGAEADEALRSLRDRDANLARVTHALERDEVEVHFQPVVDLRTGRLRDVEALARIRTPERLLAAGEFIDLVHDIGETAALDAQVLRRVEESARSLARVTRQMFVNVSPLSLAVPSFRGIMTSTIGRLREEGVDVVLVLELTEQALLEHHDVIGEIHRAHGVRFAVDDFGTGYSSLKTVTDLAVGGVVSTLKIDGSLTRHVTESAPAFKVVLAVAHLAKSLDLRSIAEHVETPEVLARLRSTGIDCGQGFLFDPPLPAAALVARYSGAVHSVPEPPPRRLGDLLEPYLHRAFEAFYELLLSDRHFARYFRDEAQVRDLIDRQQRTFLESLDDDAEALQRRYVGLGRLHSDLGLPLPIFFEGADLLHEELLGVLVHATNDVALLRDTERFFAALRRHMARGYLERQLPRLRAELDAQRAMAERASIHPRGRALLLGCVEAVFASVEARRPPVSGTPARGIRRPDFASAASADPGAASRDLVGETLEACPATLWLEQWGARVRSAPGTPFASRESVSELHRRIHGDADTLGFLLARGEDAAVGPLLEGVVDRLRRVLLGLGEARGV